MYNYFKSIAESNSCALKGACSIHPSINALVIILQEELKEISFYLVKLRELNFINYEINNICIDALSIFLINTSFNQEKYLDLIKKLNQIKKEVKEKYIRYCSEKNISCEIIKKEITSKNNLTMAQLIKDAEKLSLDKQKNCDKEKLCLFELIYLFSKLSAIISVKIRNENGETKELNYEILRFLALTNSFSIRHDKLNRRIKEFSNIFIEANNLLNLTYEKNYGEKKEAKINFNNKSGHNILISGSDLNELKILLETIEKTNSKNLNVYTHGPMYMAHFYPYFQKNNYLKGHVGTNDAEYDFSNFHGAILLTQNFIQKIDNLYRGEIFSNKIISFYKVTDIQNFDYTPLINTALKVEGYENENEINYTTIAYDKNLLKNMIKDYSEEEISIVIGNIEKENKFTEYKNKKILHINCPCDILLLLDAINTLQKRNVKISIFFAQCSLENLKTIFSLLDKKLNLYMTNCPHVLINPHAIEALKKNFNLKLI